MKRYIVLFSDNEEHANMRLLHMESHLKFLEANSDKIQAAGPIFEGESEASAGGLWLVSAVDVAQVKSLVRDDPFWPTGLRKNVDIFLWKEVFRNGDRLTH